MKLTRFDIRLKWRLQRVKLDSISATNPLKIDQEMITNQWFIGALVATILWVTFVLVILVMRKRIHLVSIFFPPKNGFFVDDGPSS